MKTVYRIYTEDKNLEFIQDELENCFLSFTIYQVLGMYKGEQEESLIVEIVATDSLHDVALVKCVAESIKHNNQQDSVLVVSFPVHSYNV